MYVTRLDDPDIVLTTQKLQSTSSGEYSPKSPTSYSVVMLSQTNLSSGPSLM